jgi:hypothetical protein
MGGQHFMGKGNAAAARQMFENAIRFYPPQIWQSDVLALYLRTFLGGRGLYLLRTLKKKLKFG